MINIEESEIKEMNNQILDRIKTHLTREQHPVMKYLDMFKKTFLGEYKSMVDNSEK